MSGIPHYKYPEKTETQEKLKKSGVRNSWQQLADTHKKNFDAAYSEIDSIFRDALKNGTAKPKSDDGFLLSYSDYDYPQETLDKISDLERKIAYDTEMYERALMSDSYGLDIYHNKNLPKTGAEQNYWIDKQHREGTRPIRGANDSELINMLNTDAVTGYYVPEWGNNVDYNAIERPLGYFDVGDYFESTNPHKPGRMSNKILHEALRRYVKSKSPNQEIAKALKRYGYTQDDLDKLRDRTYKL